MITNSQLALGRMPGQKFPGGHTRRLRGLGSTGWQSLQALQSTSLQLGRRFGVVGAEVAAAASLLPGTQDIRAVEHGVSGVCGVLFFNICSFFLADKPFVALSCNRTVPQSLGTGRPAQAVKLRLIQAL